MVKGVLSDGGIQQLSVSEKAVFKSVCGDKGQPARVILILKDENHIFEATTKFRQKNPANSLQDFLFASDGKGIPISTYISRIKALLPSPHSERRYPPFYTS